MILLFSLQRKMETRKTRPAAQVRSEGCYLKPKSSDTRTFTSPPCASSEPQVKTQVFLVKPPPCVPCFWDAPAVVLERIRGPRWVREAGKVVDPSLGLVGLMPPSDAEARAAHLLPKFPASLLCTFLNSHRWKISRSEHDWRTSSSLLSRRAYMILFSTKEGSLKNEVEVPKEIASISSRA